MLVAPADLIAYANIERIAQLAVPADQEALPVGALRIAVDGGDLTVYESGVQAACAGALKALDQACNDAHELLVSCGLKEAHKSSLITRLGGSVAHFYLHGAQHIPESVEKSYAAALNVLRRFQKNEVNLLPAGNQNGEAIEGAATVAFGTSARRFSGAAE